VPLCTCDPCYMLRPGESACVPDPSCFNTAIGRPNRLSQCRSDRECQAGLSCEDGICLCRWGNMVNQRYEITCRKSGCASNSDCAAGFTCLNTQCQDLCGSLKCPTGKTCRVIGGKPVCACESGFGGVCNASISICLKDTGCPDRMLCSGYQCEDPCRKNPCGIGQVCDVRNHVMACNRGNCHRLHFSCHNSLYAISLLRDPPH